MQRVYLFAFVNIRRTRNILIVSCSFSKKTFKNMREKNSLECMVVISLPCLVKRALYKRTATLHHDLSTFIINITHLKGRYRGIICKTKTVVNFSFRIKTTILFKRAKNSDCIIKIYQNLW